MANTVSNRSLDDALRARFMAVVRDALANAGEELLVTGSNEYAVPCVDASGNDKYMVIKFTVPSGSRDGDPYDGYAMAQAYQMRLDAKAAKAKEAAAKKAAKIAKDKAAREAKAKAKAEAQAE